MDEETKAEVAEMVAGSRPFLMFDEEELLDFLEIGSIATFEEDDLLFVEGNPGESAYVLLEGKADVVKGIEGGEEELLITIDPVSIVGEMGFLTGEPRSATGRCQTEVRTLKIDRYAYDDVVLDNSPGALKFGLNLARILASRLYNTDEALMKLLSELYHDEDVERTTMQDVSAIRQILYRDYVETE